MPKLSFPPHGNPGSMQDTTPRNGPDVRNLKPAARGRGRARAAMARLKGLKKRRRRG